MSYFQLNCSVELIYKVCDQWASGSVELEQHTCIKNIYQLHLYYTIIQYDHWVQNSLMVAFYWNTVDEACLRRSYCPFSTDGHWSSWACISFVLNKMYAHSITSTCMHSHLHSHLHPHTLHVEWSHEKDRREAITVVMAQLLLFDDLLSSVSLFYIHDTNSICISAMKYGCCVKGRELADLWWPPENE